MVAAAVLLMVGGAATLGVVFGIRSTSSSDSLPQAITIVNLMQHLKVREIEWVTVCACMCMHMQWGCVDILHVYT